MRGWIVSVTGAFLGLAGNAALAQDKPPSLPVNIDTAGAVNSCLPVSERARPLVELSAERRRSIVACIFTATAAQINSQLPAQVDEITRLDRISVSGPVLTYHYTLSRRLAELPPNVQQLAEAGTRANGCRQANMRQTMEMGGAYEYRWVDADGRLVHQFRLDAC